MAANKSIGDNVSKGTPAPRFYASRCTMKWPVTVTAFVLASLAIDAYADDVNRTGQTQSVDTGKSGTAATKGGDANTMGGGNATSTLPSQQPQVAPPNGTQPAPDESHKNSEPDSSSGTKN